MENTANVRESIKDKYRSFIVTLLREHKIKSMSCYADTERFFDKVEVNDDGSLCVYRNGLNEPLDNFYFDYTCDFARCISYIEDAIYQQRHGINGEHCIAIKFEPEDQPAEKPPFWTYVGTLKRGSDEWRLAMEIGLDYFDHGKNPDEHLNEIKTEVKKKMKNKA